jgi:hypothetical protein
VLKPPISLNNDHCYQASPPTATPHTITQILARGRFLSSPLLPTGLYLSLYLSRLLFLAVCPTKWANLLKEEDSQSQDRGVGTGTGPVILPSYPMLHRIEGSS